MLRFHDHICKNSLLEVRMSLDRMKAKWHMAPFSVGVSGTRQLRSEWAAAEPSGLSRLSTVFPLRITIFTNISPKKYLGIIHCYGIYTVTSSNVLTQAVQQALRGPASRISNNLNPSVTHNCELNSQVCAD